MKISQTSFKEICSVLGRNEFNIHTEAEDHLRTVKNEEGFEQARKELMDGFGDVEISLHPDAHWFDRVQIEDEKWKTAYEAFCEAKAAWCAKYGCD